MEGERVAIDASMAKGDQQALLLTVVNKIKEWVQCATASDNNNGKAQSFKPHSRVPDGCKDDAQDQAKASLVERSRLLATREQRASPPAKQLKSID